MRIVCANTQSAAIARAKSTFGIRHTNGARVAIQEARTALGLAWRYMDAFETEAVALYAAPMELDHLRDFAARLVKADDKTASVTARRGRQQQASSIVKLWTSSPTLAPILSCQLRMTRASCAGRCVENAFVTHRSPLPRSCRSPDR